MKTMIKLTTAALGAAALLAGCSPIALAPAGAYKVGAGTVTLDRPWNDISGLWVGRPEKVRLLSLDGPLLNRLYVTDGLESGDAIVRSPRRETRTPVYADAMSVTEQVEFVGESVTALGYERVATSGVRPVELNGQRAVRFDIEAATGEGLDIRGIGQAAKRDGKLYVAIYLAPAEHYFEAARPSAENAMGGVTN